MRKTLLLIVVLFLFSLSLLAAPVRRGSIPHPLPCHPGEYEADGMCYCPELAMCGE